MSGNFYSALAEMIRDCIGSQFVLSYAMMESCKHGIVVSGGEEKPILSFFPFSKPTIPVFQSGQSA